MGDYVKKVFGAVAIGDIYTRTKEEKINKLEELYN